MLKVRVLTAAILSCLLLLGLFALAPRWMVLVFAAVLVGGAWEWGGFGELRPAARAGYAAGVAALLWAAWRFTAQPSHLIGLLTAACLWWTGALLWIVAAPARRRPVLALFVGVAVLVPAFVAIARLLGASGGVARGPVLVLWLLLLVIAADVGGFFVGRRFGRHKLAPRVSPGKTWEGAAGGLAAVALVAAAGAVRFSLPVAGAVGFGCAVGLFSIVGDLTESQCKRSAGLKDSGHLLPGHGGILDRIDSITAAAPLYALGLFGSGVIS